MSKGHISNALRERIAEQAQHRCGYCLTREVVIGARMDIEHLLPEAVGGRTIEDNLWLSCQYCNSYKSDQVTAIDPQSGDEVLLYNPRRQDWEKHFHWSADGTLIIGLTAVGRATVLALQLNRAPLVKSRGIWVASGWHPPTD